MEAIAANLILLIVLIGKGVHIGLSGHGLVKRGVENRHHRSVRHKCLTCLDSDNIGGVVEGGQGVALLNGSHDLPGDENRLGKLLSAMDHPVTHSVDLLHGADDAVVLVHQGIQHSLDGLVVGGHGHVGLLNRLLPLGLIGKFAVNADALAQALGQHLLGFRIEQLILQRGTAGVDYQNIHGTRLLLKSNLGCLPAWNVIQWRQPG